MNRRAFLAWLGGTAAGVALAPTLDLDKLLWVPGEKKIFIPPPPQLTTPIGLAKGDIFTIDGLFAMNPMTGKSMHGVLQKFIITSDVSAGAISVEPVYPHVEIPRGSRVTKPRNTQVWAVA